MITTSLPTCSCRHAQVLDWTVVSCAEIVGHIGQNRPPPCAGVSSLIVRRLQNGDYNRRPDGGPSNPPLPFWLCNHNQCHGKPLDRFETGSPVTCSSTEHNS